MCITDDQPSFCDLKPIQLDPPRPSITDVELAALRGVDLAERINEPLNPFDFTRAVVRLAAHIARRFRQ